MHASVRCVRRVRGTERDDDVAADFGVGRVGEERDEEANVALAEARRDAHELAERQHRGGVKHRVRVAALDVNASHKSREKKHTHTQTKPK